MDSLEHIHKLFIEVIKLLVELGYVDLEVQYIDGIKIESSANRYTFDWHKSIVKYKDKLEVRIQSVIGVIESTIQSDHQII